MSYKIYHNPRCSKSRQTLQLLQNHTHEVEVIEYLKTPPSKEELRQIITRLKIDPMDLVRKGEEIYKTSFKGKSYTDEQWLDIMIENPKLIERPIVIHDTKAIIGRPPENVTSLF